MSPLPPRPQFIQSSARSSISSPTQEVARRLLSHRGRRRSATRSPPSDRLPLLIRYLLPAPSGHRRRPWRAISRVPSPLGCPRPPMPRLPFQTWPPSDPLLSCPRPPPPHSLHTALPPPPRLRRPPPSPLRSGSADANDAAAAAGTAAAAPAAGTAAGEERPPPPRGRSAPLGRRGLPLLHLSSSSCSSCLPLAGSEMKDSQKGSSSIMFLQNRPW